MVAERIREVLRKPFQVEGYEGHARSPSPPASGSPPATAPSAQELLRDADIALYRAKAKGRDCYAVFEAAMQSAALDRLELKSDLDSALGNDQFFLLYQPIFDLDTFRIRGVEALLRWRHPTRGVIPPDNFIPVLEDSGHDRRRSDSGCSSRRVAQAADLASHGHPHNMSVNVSMRQLETDVLVDRRRRRPWRPAASNRAC